MPSKNKLSNKEILHELVMLDRVTNALNTAVCALMYIEGIKGNEMDKVKPEDFEKFVSEHIHPLMARADAMVKEIAKKAKKDIDKATEEVEEESK